MTHEFSVDQISTLVHKALAVWKVNGAAVTVVKDGEVLLCEGFGLRNVAQQQPVTPHTLFPIASCSKAFTAMSVGLLVDEGKIEWDKPLREYMPAFKLHDPVASERITPRDLLTHRSGLPRHDLIWYASNFSRKEIFDRLKHLELSKDIRTTFQYNNLMFMVAGLLVTEMTGLSWEKFVQARIFDVIGMSHSTFSTLAAKQAPDFATPYVERDGNVLEVPFYENDGERDAVGPAGNIVSCVADMANWLRVHTSGGKPLVSQASLNEMHSPQMVLSDQFGRMHFNYDLSSYGLGWFLHAYKGQVMSEHGGNLDGFSSLTSVIPSANVGVVVLCNGNGTALPSVITHYIYDQWLGLEATDWNDRLKPLWDEFRAGEKASHSRSATERNAEAKPSHPLDAYLGEYEHPGYGIIAIRKAGNESDALQMVINDKIALPLEHYHFDYFEAYWDTWDSYIKVAFGTDVRGKISHLTTQMEPAVKDTTFVRLPDRHLLDSANLAQFAGEYEVMGMPFVVTLKSDSAQRDALWITIEGELSERLIPYQGTEFQVKDKSGFSIEFKQDAAGKVDEMLMVRPGAVFTAKKISK